MRPVRKPRVDEAEAIFALLHDTVKRVNSQHYTPAQIATWLGGRNDEITEEQIREDHWWICVDDSGDLLGLGTLADNNITGLYVNADRLGEGIGTAILAHMERQIRSGGDVTEILVESTTTAAEFYRRKGYEEIDRGQVGPARLDVVNMRKRLTSAAVSS